MCICISFILMYSNIPLATRPLGSGEAGGEAPRPDPARAALVVILS